MKQKKGFVGPLILLTTGIILLLNSLEILPWEIWLTLWRYWPVILILFGLEILAIQSETRLTYFLAALICMVIIGGSIFLALKGIPQHQEYFKDISGKDLNGMDLEGEDLNFARLESVNLSNSNMNGVNMNFADLENADLRNSSLNGANLNFASMKKADLSNADMQGINMNFANLENANLSGASMSGANLKFAKLKGAITSSSTTCPDNRFGPCW